MNNPFIVKNLTLGDGIPKICVPLVDTQRESLLWGAVLAKTAAADLVEWRADFYEQSGDTSSVLRTAEALRAALRESPLLFTFRTQAEGGQKSLSKEAYLHLIQRVAASGWADLIDIELSQGDDLVAALVEEVHRHGVKAVVSSHDFSGTPPKEAMLNRLHRMRKLGADIPKLATSPKTFTDVLSLMSITEEFSQNADCPVITMSMGKLGQISRIAGAYTGSAVTFGSVENGSAPGQLPVRELRDILKTLSHP